MPVQHAKNKPIVIGLTGGIATGKSTASSYLKKQHIPVIDSDEIVKDLWNENQEMLSDIKSVFHTLNKKTIANIIYNDTILRNELNAIVHPYVFAEIRKQLKTLQYEKIIVIDMPLLFEVGYQNRVDYTAVVYVDKNDAKIRLMVRDSVSDQEAEKRIAAQMSIDEKCILADFVLDNSKSKAVLYETIDYMLRSILNEE